MKTRFCFLILLTLGVFLLHSATIAACSCARGNANPCAAFRGDGSIFIGTVTEVADSNEKYGKPVKGGVRKIKIRVDEVFKGAFPAEIITSDDGFSCDNFPFALGKTYLIYSRGVTANTENVVEVGLCGGTSSVERAGGEIDILRRLKAGEKISLLSGTIQKVVRRGNNPHEPLNGAKVLLTADYIKENGQSREPKKRERTFETVTNERGEYRFENLAAGRYKLKAILPAELWTPDTREFWTGGVPSCDVQPLYAYANGSIGGTIVTADGAPAALKVGIKAADDTAALYYPETRTDKNGNYTFHGLAAGNYKIFVGLSEYSTDGSRTYLFDSRYPFPNYYYANAFEDAQAQAVNLSHLEKIQNINLKMPPPPVKQTVKGVAVWEDGTAVRNAIIYYKPKNIPNSSPRYANSAADGTFSFETFEEFEYEIAATSNDPQNPSAFNWQTYNKNDLRGEVKLILKPDKRP